MKKVLLWLFLGFAIVWTSISIIALYSYIHSTFYIEEDKINENIPIKNKVISKVSENLNNNINKTQISIWIPINIKIPEINLIANIASVGLINDNTLDVAKDFADVWWYNLNSKPGEIGSAVIDGHYGWKKSVWWVFNDLDKLKIWDDIYIKDDNWNLINFVVKSSKIYSEYGDTSDIFNSTDWKSHLNLISCYGPWDNTKKAYPSRIVIFTDKKIKN